MRFYIVGNSEVKDDSLPTRCIPDLQKAFPTVSIIEVDPNENFIPEEGSVIIDTVKGIDRVTVFRDIDRFVTRKSVSPHDYDLGFHLNLLYKLKKISRITILGVPGNWSRGRVVDQLTSCLNRLAKE